MTFLIPDQVQDLIDQAVAAFGRLDILVNNAGIEFKRPFLEFPAKRWGGGLAGTSAKRNLSDQGGCNLQPYNGAFAVELPLDKFILTQGFTFTDVVYVDFIFQDGSPIGAVSFGITSIELSNTTKSGIVIDCHY